jgi:hypothetical protein
MYPAITLRVLGALGQLREQVHESLTSVDGSQTLSRKGFLRLGAGATIAGGLLFTGVAPAFAEQRRSAAALWVAANRDKLPQTYQAITAYSLDYRQAIYRALPVPGPTCGANTSRVTGQHTHPRPRTSSGSSPSWSGTSPMTRSSRPRRPAPRFVRISSWPGR